MRSNDPHIKIEHQNITGEINGQDLIVPFDFDGTREEGFSIFGLYLIILDYQRYENRNKGLKNLSLNTESRSRFTRSHDLEKQPTITYV
jgi:hypothetical protein